MAQQDQYVVDSDGHQYMATRSDQLEPEQHESEPIQSTFKGSKSLNSTPLEEEPFLPEYNEFDGNQSQSQLSHSQLPQPQSGQPVRQMSKNSQSLYRHTPVTLSSTPRGSLVFDRQARSPTGQSNQQSQYLTQSNLERQGSLIVGSPSFRQRYGMFQMTFMTDRPYEKLTID